MKELDEIKAIALEYGKREAPSILAKGEGEEAMSIIDAAFELGLPVIEDEKLQRLLSGDRLCCVHSQLVRLRFDERHPGSGAIKHVRVQRFPELSSAAAPRPRS